MRGNGNPVPATAVDWRVLKSLLPYLTEFKLRVLLALLCLVAAKVASIGMPVVLKHLVDGLDSLDERALAAAFPLGLLLAYGCARLSNVLLGELRDTLFGRVTERAMRRIGLKIFQHLHQLDLDFHLNRRTGGLSRDIERGVGGISFLLRFMVFNIVPTLIEITMVVGLLWWNYHLGFALIVLLAVITYVGFSVLATEWRTGFLRKVNEAESRSSTRSVDSLLNYETVKYFTNENYEANFYDRELGQWENARQQNRLSLLALNGGQAFIISASITGALALAAQQVIAQSMTLGDFVLVNALMMQIFLPLNFLGFVYREMKGSMASIEQMFGLLAEQPNIKDTENAKPLAVNGGSIEFKDVAFDYKNNRKILQRVSFTLAPKQKVAIVGRSGAGKSTLFKLLFRFYDPSAGEINIDGQNIRNLTLSSLRQAIGVVPQDAVLFNQSLMDNIRYGRVDATDEQVMEAIELAHLGDFVRQLPEGVDTLVGERGLKLSGGEKQRVAIARAILKRPPIMVFDEATSSLDTESEQIILKALSAIAKEQTTLVIAHRLSTIIDADKIVVLDSGSIVEQGNHKSLLASKGLYHKLWLRQQQQEVSSIELDTV